MDWGRDGEGKGRGKGNFRLDWIGPNPLFRFFPFVTVFVGYVPYGSEHPAHDPSGKYLNPSAYVPIL